MGAPGLVRLPIVKPALDEVRRLLRGADRTLALTGAGVSAESGVPTFRGEEGLWKSYRPEDLATPQAFRRDPRLVWEWYAWRRELVAKCAPNAGHHALAGAAGSGRMSVVTQNVDGLHERAAREASAFSETLELHGSLFRDRCEGCGVRFPARADVDTTSEEDLPRCPVCSGLLRPDVVWFGESLDQTILNSAFSAALEADVCLVVGTSALVQPAASIPLATLEGGGVLVEVNPESTPLTALSAVSVRGRASEVLPALFA